MIVDINNMPEAIKDGCLKDTFVIVSYNTDYSKEYLEELIVKKLSDDLGPNVFSKIPLVVNGNVEEGKWFWANNQYRFMFDGGTIQFNIVNQYPKWTEYSRFIKRVLSVLDDKIIYKLTTIRYVSIFYNIELSKMIDGTLKMNQLDAFAGAQYRFQCSARNEDNEMVASAEVQLSDRYQMQDQSLNSIIDIRVWRESTGNLNDAFAALDLVHKHQKHLFFLLLSEPFYNQLKI